MSLQTTFVNVNDAEIRALASDREVYEYRDIELNKTVGKRLHPYPNGIFDDEIFGSLFPDSCMCGKTTDENIECIECHTQRLSIDRLYSRFAYIEAPFYFCSEYRFAALKSLVQESFKLMHVYDEDIDDEESSIVEKRITIISRDLIENCQVYFKNDFLVFSEVITNAEESSYEGLLSVVATERPELLGNFSALLSRLILVIPPVNRPVRYEYDRVANSRQLKTHPLNAKYKTIIYLIQEVLPEALKAALDPKSVTEVLACFRLGISKLSDDLSQVPLPSKSSIGRQAYSTRVDNSGRAVIVADPTLMIDELALPIHLAYEVFGEYFLEYLEGLGYSRQQAEMQYNEEYKSMMELFKEFMKDRRVIAGRAPVLHEYNMLSFKVKLSNDFVIGYPLMSCDPFNADKLLMSAA